uniref:TTF-type domain-containing protein n=1 Tax=Davidia involucrata TaxID=16924 RepID=A0A5B7BMF7_DAVIN
MDKFLKRKSTLEQPSPTQESDDRGDGMQHCSKQSRIEINLENLPADPGLRIKILNYHTNDRDEIRRAYFQKGPCQPREHNFPQRKFGKALRRFNTAWFNEFGNWLEYSIEKDVVFCLCCL